MTTKHFNKLFLKEYKKSKSFNYDKDMISELYNLFVENYKTTGYIFDKSTISYLKNDCIELPKNLNSTCICLKEITEIIYIFDKIIENNYDTLTMDVMYNINNITGKKVNKKYFTNKVFCLTGICIKNLYLIKLMSDADVKCFENDKNVVFIEFYEKIIDTINKYIDNHSECKQNYNYVKHLSNKNGQLTKFLKTTVFTIKFLYYSIIKPFFIWLTFSDGLIPNNTSTVKINKNFYQNIVECINYALDRLNSKPIIDLMFKYERKPFEEYFSDELREQFKKPSNEITSETNKLYVNELTTISNMVENDYDHIKINMHGSILEVTNYVVNLSLMLMVNK